MSAFTKHASYKCAGRRDNLRGLPASENNCLYPYYRMNILAGHARESGQDHLVPSIGAMRRPNGIYIDRAVTVV